MKKFCDKWGGWFTKVTAVLLAAAYLVIITVFHGSPYVWLSLTLVLMLCLTMFAYTRDSPVIRWRRNAENQNATTTETINENEEPQMTEIPAAIWMTDIPPSYSFIVEGNAPVTPPPSYGSALIMFPWIATGQQSPEVSRLLENARFRSVSRQVSETSGIYNCNSSLSRQTSRIDTISVGISPISLSRQTSRQETISSARQLAISRQISQATVLSKQISIQENKQQQNTSSVLIDEQITNSMERENQLAGQVEENQQNVNSKKEGTETESCLSKDFN